MVKVAGGSKNFPVRFENLKHATMVPGLLKCRCSPGWRENGVGLVQLGASSTMVTCKTSRKTKMRERGKGSGRWSLIFY